MTHGMRRLSTAARLMALLLLLGGAGGCDWWEDPSPDRVSFALMEGEGEYQVLLSTVFVAGFTGTGQTQVELIESDTLVVTTPFLDEVDIRGDQRFFIRVLASDTVGAVNSVRLTVDIDDENRFDRRAQVGEEPIFFLYQFNGQVFTDDIQVF